MNIYYKLIKALSIICLIFLIEVAYSQTVESLNSKSTNIHHAIDFEPFAVTYTLSQDYFRNGNFGFGLQFGPALRFFLNSPTYLKKTYTADSANNVIYITSKLNAGSYLYEFIQLKIFYRIFLTDNTYINAAGFVGIGVLNDLETAKVHNSIGIQSDIITGFKHIKFGSRLQFCNINISYTSDKKTNFFGLLFTPILIQYYF